MFGPAADGQQHMRADDLGRALGAVDADGDLVAALGEADALGVQADIDAFALEDLLDRGGDILVFARDQARRHFDDRDLAAEAAEHLGEFEADIAAADDHQMPRQEIDLHHRAVGEEGDLVEPGHVGHDGPSADIDEDPLGAQPLRRRPRPRAATKPRMSS